MDNRSAAISSSPGVINRRRNYGGSRVSIVQRRFSYGVAGFCRNGRPALPELVAGLLRNRWPESTGMGGRLGPESVVGFRRNTQSATLLGLELALTSPEDLVIAKLEWSVLGDSELQRRDLIQLLESVGSTLDRRYVEGWISRLGLESAWRAVLDRLEG